MKVPELAVTLLRAGYEVKIVPTGRAEHMLYKVAPTYDAAAWDDFRAAGGNVRNEAKGGCCGPCAALDDGCGGGCGEACCGGDDKKTKAGEGCGGSCGDACCGGDDAKKEEGCGGSCGDACCGGDDAKAGKAGEGCGGSCGDACCGGDDAKAGKTGEGDTHHSHPPIVQATDQLSVLAAASGAVADGRLLTCGSIVLNPCGKDLAHLGCLQVFQDSDEWQYHRVGDEVLHIQVRLSFYQCLTFKYGSTSSIMSQRELVFRWRTREFEFNF